MIFSNSVIEHVGGREDQLKMAEECLRVGKDIYIQTPNQWFFMEPHLVTPFIHWLPRKIYFLLSPFSIWRILRGKSSQEAKSLAENCNLLSGRELQSMFKNIPIFKELFFGMTKSFVVSSRKMKSMPKLKL